MHKTLFKLLLLGVGVGLSVGDFGGQDLPDDDQQFAGDPHLAVGQVWPR